MIITHVDCWIAQYGTITHHVMLGDVSYYVTIDTGNNVEVRDDNNSFVNQLIETEILNELYNFCDGDNG